MYVCFNVYNKDHHLNNINVYVQCAKIYIYVCKCVCIKEFMIKVLFFNNS